MIKKLRYTAAAAAFAATLGMSSVAHADNADADATAEILQALTLTVATGTQLDFATLVVGGAGTVTVDPDGTRSACSANLVCSGTTSAPQFDISGGNANLDVTVTLPSTTSTLLRVGGTGGNAADEIILGSFTDDTTAGEVTLNGTGDGSFNVGGTITLDGSEVPGVYDGTFNVSVAYS